MPDKLPPKILVVEPDEVQNASLCNTIERHWFDVIRVKNSESAISLAQVHHPHVVVISSRIEDSSAIELASRIKKTQDTQNLPIVFLIEEQESVQNYIFDKGELCDAVQRPFTPNELITTIRSLLRKSKPVFQDRIIQYNDIKMDLSTFKVQRAQKQIHLGPTEFKILQLFIQKPKNIFSRKQIIDYVWGSDKNISQRTIDVHINRIRSLMKLKTDQYSLIKTIRSAGYCLD